MAQSKIDALFESLHQIQTQLEMEVQTLLEQKQAQFRYSLRKGRVTFEREIRKLHRSQRVNVFLYVFTARVGHILTAPIIYSLMFPVVIMDLMFSLYQSICFRVYGIPFVRRSDYILIDRHKLAYLNIIEKFNCVYCGYGNGVIEYVREIAARTEQYWCPIRHARILHASHDLANNFVDYGDAKAYREGLDEIRLKISSLESPNKK